MQFNNVICLIISGLLLIVESVQIHENTTANHSKLESNSNDHSPLISLNDLNSTGPILFADVINNQKTASDTNTTIPKLSNNSSNDNIGKGNQLKFHTIGYDGISLTGLQPSFYSNSQSDINKTEIYDEKPFNGINKEGKSPIDVKSNNYHRTFPTKPFLIGNFSPKKFIPSPEVITKPSDYSGQMAVDNFQPIQFDNVSKQTNYHINALRSVRPTRQNSLSISQATLQTKIIPNQPDFSYSNNDIKATATVHIESNDRPVPIPNRWNYRESSPEYSNVPTPPEAKIIVDQDHDLGHVANPINFNSPPTAPAYEHPYHFENVNGAGDTGYHDIPHNFYSYTGYANSDHNNNNPSTVIEHHSTVQPHFHYEEVLYTPPSTGYNPTAPITFPTGSGGVAITEAGISATLPPDWDSKANKQKAAAAAASARRTSWSKIITILSTIIPIGLLLSALTPNVVYISPNSTSSQYSNPGGLSLGYFKDRQRSLLNDNSTETDVEEIFDILKKCNENNDLNANPICQEKILCELIATDFFQNKTAFHDLLLKKACTMDNNNNNNNNNKNIDDNIGKSHDAMESDKYAVSVKTPKK